MDQEQASRKGEDEALPAPSSGTNEKEEVIGCESRLTPFSSESQQQALSQH